MYEIQSATIQRHLYDLDFFLNSLLLIYNETPVFLKKMGKPRHLYVYFHWFQSNITIFTTN